ncbi:MAG TPA: AsmA-like C-terminal domain-containing protein [Candidatus Binatia bacterium]|nr:AsmA-like C-terminal domain-containing protein [Candidatus Binatia bacterium]
MRKTLKFFGVVLFTLVLFVIVASLGFYHLIRGGELQRFLVSEIEAKTEFKVQLGEADLEMGRILAIGFSDFALFEPDAPRPAITAQRMTARVALLPLFERKLILYGVRLHKPTARLVRDKEGRLPLLEKFRNLPFLTQEATQFGLDLHAIRIQDGEVDFEDQQAEGDNGTTRFRDVDLELERIRGQQLRDFVGGLIKRKRPEPKGVALSFEVKSGVENNGKKTTLRAKGKMVFPEEVLMVPRAWLNADVQLSNLPAEMLQRYAGSVVPLQSVKGVLTPQFHIEGNPAEQLRLTGDLLFTQLVVEDPNMFSSPLSPGDGKADFDIDWTKQRLGISRFDLRSNELKLTLRGEVRSKDSPDPHVQLNLSAPFLPFAVYRKYLPLKMIGPPQQWETWIGALQEGEFQLKKAAINGNISEIRRLPESIAKGRISLDGELRNGAGKPAGEGYLSLRRVQGRLKLENGIFAFNDFEGNYGETRLSDVNGKYQPLPSGQATFEIRARGDLDLTELHQQMKVGILPAEASKLASSVQDMGGRGKMELAVRRAADASLQTEGKIVLDDARLRMGEYYFTEVKGDLTFTPKEIRGEKVKALLSESPIQIQLALKDYGADNGTFDLSVDSTGVKAGVIARLLLSTGSLQDPGIVSGFVHYHGPLGTQEGRKFTANLDLVNVQLAVEPLLQPLRELSGKITIDEAGIDFQNLKGLLVGFPATFNGRWRYAEKPQLLFDFSAPNLDISYLISQIDPEAQEFYAKLQGEGKIALAKGRIKSFDFTDFNSDVTIDRRVWRLISPTMRAASGTIRGVATIADKPETLGVSAQSKIEGVSVQTFLNWFDMTTTEMTGKVNLTGNVETIGKDAAERKRNLNGAFALKIEDGIIRRMRILVQILNLLDLSRWFTLQMPDLAKEGIRFRSISGDFKITRGVYETQNLVVDSNDLRMTGAGKIDVARDEIDFVVAVRPFAGIDTAINYIPLIGRGIAAIKNSFLVASFNIRGAIEDPTITPAPLSTMSEWVFGVLGIPKNIIGWGGDEKKQEPQNSPPKDSAKEKARPTTK